MLTLLSTMECHDELGQKAIQLLGMDNCALEATAPLTSALAVEETEDETA